MIEEDDRNALLDRSVIFFLASRRALLVDRRRTEEASLGVSVEDDQEFSCYEGTVTGGLVEVSEGDVG